MIWIRCVRGLGCMPGAQRDPLTEYKFAAYDMFEEMSNHIQEDTLKILYRVRIQTEVKQEEPQQQMFTNKDDSAVKQPKSVLRKKSAETIPCPAAAAEIYSAVGGTHKESVIKRKKKHKA